MRKSLTPFKLISLRFYINSVFVLNRWCLSVESIYQDCIYHTVTHAADVLHGCYASLQVTPTREESVCTRTPARSTLRFAADIWSEA